MAKVQKSQVTSQKSDSIETPFKTRKDYPRGESFTFSVATKDNVVMSNGFPTREIAEDFRDNAYGGYYADCIVCFGTYRREVDHVG